MTSRNLKSLRVLVTDAEMKHTLAAVRGLAQAGDTVITSSFKRFNLAPYSKDSKGFFRYPNPSTDEEGFIAAISREIARRRIDVVLPIGTESTIALAKHREKLPPVKLPIADYGQLLTAYDKAETFKLVQTLSVPCPKTYVPASLDEVKRIAKEVSYPVVVKIRRGSSSKGVVYPKDGRELLNLYQALHEQGKKSEFLDYTWPIIQEFIPAKPGTAGVGYFALLNHGELRARFMHARVREYPHSGGASTAAQSIPIDPAVEGISLKILMALKWHGIMMCEYRLDARDGLPKLIELNPKFWGSLDLPIAAGVNFPALAARMAASGDIAPVLSYRTGVEFRWTLEREVLHVLDAPKKWTAVRAIFSRRPNTYTNLRWNDPLPNLALAARTVAKVGQHTLRHAKARIKGAPGPQVPSRKVALEEITRPPAMKRPMAFDLHLHCHHSFDSNTGIEAIVKAAKKKGLSGLAICDHNNMEGSRELARLQKAKPHLFPKPFFVVPAAEMTSEIGDLLCLIVKEPIHTNDALGIERACRAQGALLVFPHPFRAHKWTDTAWSIAERCDAVEAANSHNEPSRNMKARALAKDLDKPVTAGSDAHTPAEVGAFAVVADDVKSLDDLRAKILGRQVRIQGAETPAWRIRAGRFTKYTKRRRYDYVARELAYMARKKAAKLIGKKVEWTPPVLPPTALDCYGPKGIYPNLPFAEAQSPANASESKGGRTGGGRTGKTTKNMPNR